MKFFTQTLALLILSALGSPVYSGIIVLEGNYQGKNLYVQNPFASSGVGFCVFEVTINDEITTDEINSSAFEIDFTAFELEIGAEVIVKIKHKDNCQPKVLNPEVLKPRSTFNVKSIKVDDNFHLRWTTTDEVSKLAYIIEQFRWNKWVKVGEVKGKGGMEGNEYDYKLLPHSGSNRVRVKQVDFSQKPRYSDDVTFKSSVDEVTFYPVKVTDKITFSSETMYEIYDKFGNIVKKGVGVDVDVANLDKGYYYISFDNATDEFIKK